MHFAPSGALYSFLPSDVEGFRSLGDIALDMHWSWNYCTDRLWRSLDAGLWRVHGDARLGRAVPLEAGRRLWQR